MPSSQQKKTDATRAMIFFAEIPRFPGRGHENDRLFREEHRIIIPLTVREILDEE